MTLPRSSVSPSSAGGAVRVFISYSHKDQKARETLDVHLAQLKREGVQFWYDGDITPGRDIDASVKRAMKAADIFVALASPDYLHSSYCFDKEYSPALRKAARGNVRVVVAVLKDCQWKHTRMAAYKALPADGRAVERWTRRGEAYEDIVNGLREVIKSVLASRTTLPIKAATRPTKKAASKKTPSVRTKKPVIEKAREKPAAAAKSGGQKPKAKAVVGPRKPLKVRPKRPRSSLPKR